MNLKQAFDIDTKRHLERAEYIAHRNNIQPFNLLPDIVLKLRNCIKDKTRRNQIYKDTETKMRIGNWEQGFCYGCTYVIYHATGQKKFWIPMELTDKDWDSGCHSFLLDNYDFDPFDLTDKQFGNKVIPYDAAEEDWVFSNNANYIPGNILARVAGIDLHR